jgi:hypothetical protein
MECRLKCERPGDIVYTLTVTMKASEWEKLRDQLDASTLSQSYPSWSLRREIDDLLAQARKIYWPRPETTSEVTSQHHSQGE